MKIDRKTVISRSDSKDEWAVRSDVELKWMFGKIQEGYAQIHEKKRELFYKEQMFRSYYKAHCCNFSPFCSAKMLFDSYAEGKFGNAKWKTPETKRILNCVVVNYFPEWMWDELEFNGAVCGGWNMRGLELHFRWKRGKNPASGDVKKETEFDFCISISNPDSILSDETFDSEFSSKGGDWVLLEDYKTRVTVCADLKKAKETGMWDYDFVCSAYMNNEIIEAIDKWARNLTA